MRNNLKSGRIGWLAALAIVACSAAVWAAETVTYTYDELGRLKSAQYPDGKKITYTYDATGNRTQAAITQNNAPVANDDSASAVTPGSVTIYVLGNDTDPNNDPITITSATSGGLGAVTVINNGTALRYDPTGYLELPFETDSFTYTISDGLGGTAEATVSVQVTPSCTPQPPHYYPPSPPC